MKKINLSAEFNFSDLFDIAHGNATYYYDNKAKEKIISVRAFLEEEIKKDKVIYGINTGFGKLANVKISQDNIALLQENLIKSHACGVGKNLNVKISRLILFLKVKSLLKGYSGVTIELLDFMVELLNRDIIPVIPAKGSVGASGDLAPLAHMSSVFLGLGEVCFNNVIHKTKDVFAKENIEIIKLQAKEGLALINGTQTSLGILLYSLLLIDNLYLNFLSAISLSIDGVKASIKPFDSKIQAVRNKHQEKIAAIIQKLLSGSNILTSHHDCTKVQDPYSFRCVPQVMGPALKLLEFSYNTIFTEIESVTDNPLVFENEKEIISGGNFHAQNLAYASDIIALALCEIGSISERRINVLIDNNMSDLPPFLIKDSGLNSGFMIAHVTVAALVSENKNKASPCSIDSIPTSAGQEDHVSMATNGANRVLDMVDNLVSICSIELLAACQAIDFQRPLTSSKINEDIFSLIRKHVPKIDNDRYFKDDIDNISALINDFQISNHIRKYLAVKNIFD